MFWRRRAAAAAAARAAALEALETELLLNYAVMTEDLLPLRCEHVWADTRFGRAHALAAGPPGGRPLLLWQGTSAPAPMMLAALGVLATTYRVYAVDSPAQSGSPSDPVHLDAARHEHGLWCRDVCASLGLLARGAPAPLHVGVSLGAAFLLDLAAVAPECIGAAACVVPGGLHPGWGTLRWRLAIAARLGPGLALAAAAPCRWTARLARRPIYDEPERAGSAAAARHSALSVRRLGLRGWRLPPMPARAEAAGLARHGAPTLVVAARHDCFGGGDAAAARAREVLRRCEAEVLPCRHVPSAARWAYINRRALGFFAARGFA